MKIDTLLKWNRWGPNLLKSGHKRHVTAAIIPFLHTEEIITLTGLRRSGKSTILYQIMDLLEDEGVAQKAMLHINFEEPALAPHLTLGLLDSLYEIYRAQVYPTGKAYLFLDEIQNVPEWERWVRARNETENIKIFITGSSSKLMSRELATLLTGRHINFNVYPLSLAELLEFKSVNIPGKPWSFSPPAEIAHAIHFYKQWGSLPRIVLAKEDKSRMQILVQYFDDILLKDLAMRHNIRDLHTLRALAVHLMTHTGSLMSFNRLGTLFGVSTMLAKDYCQYLQETFLLELMPFFSLKVAERQRNPQKIYALDCGLRNQVSLSLSPDEGKSIESIVFNTLKQQGHYVYYWKNRGEVDFVIHRGNTITSVVQVMADGLSDPNTLKRELDALNEATKAFPNAKPFLIVSQNDIPANMANLARIPLIPLWQFLLNPEIIQ
jgi:predicted AAA+ superfamily ATPase